MSGKKGEEKRVAASIEGAVINNIGRVKKFCGFTGKE